MTTKQANIILAKVDKIRVERDQLRQSNNHISAILKRFARAMKQGSYPELQGIACEAFNAIENKII